MAAEDAKRKRSAAKGRLTRATRALEEYISSENVEYDLLKSIFSDVENAWHNLEEKHDEFISVVENPDDENNEELMRICQSDFYKARKIYHACKIEVEHDDQIKKLTRLRDVKYHRLLESFKNIEDLLALNHAPDTIKREMLSVTRQFEEVKQKHAEVIYNLKGDDKSERSWLVDLTALYSNISKGVDVYIKDMQGRGNIQSTALQLQKMPLPKFDGDVKKYARFKSDFLEIVNPTVVGNEGAFILRQCLDPDVSKMVENCRDVDSMMKRLDERFGDPSKLVDVVVSEISKFKQIDVNDDKKLIEFIHLIEAGYRDLKSIKLEKEISNANIVSIIENKLPRNVALQWFREIHKKDSKVDKSDKFPYLLEFLCVERRSVEYGLSELRISSVKHSAKVNLAGYEENVVNESNLAEKRNSEKNEASSRVMQIG